MKIIDKIRAAEAEGRTLFSFEFFPPRTEEGVDNLLERLDRMAARGPAFCDITWGAGGTTADVTLDIAAKMQNLICVETMMHLTCTNMPADKIDAALEAAKKAGLCNILALRGDPPKGQESFEQVEGGYACALDLVKHIRAKYGDYFGIAVAGYPEGHPDGIVEGDAAATEANYRKGLAYLKEKMDAGGDLIVTQLFYDTKRFLSFVKDCRAIGITQPILPGVMPIMTYGGFKRMTGFCKTDVPQGILDQIEAVKDDEEALRELGIKLGAEMCRELLDSGTVPGLHMYSLNLERSAVAILEEVGVLPKLDGATDAGAAAAAASPNKQQERPPLPWRCVPRNSQRALEGVRPIHWSNRPRSYHHRTADWDRFPSGRWGDSASPAYGTLAGYPFMRRHGKSDARRERALAAWGRSPTSVADVRDVFVRHCTEEGLPGGVGLPWAEMAEGGAAWHAESAPIRSSLAALNRAGYLTINSQPAVDGARSDDPVHGWGPRGGRVYQKAYVEAFVAPDRVAALLDTLSAARGGDGSVTYLATDAKGTELRTNAPKPDAINAVTWGVFPASEVLQPTVVDPASFRVWKDEAFAIWRDEWACLYEEGSASRKLLEEIADTWWLVSVVDNDYVEGGDLCAVFGVDATGAPAAANGAKQQAPALV